jgi:hypothetical protein
MTNIVVLWFSKVAGLYPSYCVTEFLGQSTADLYYDIIN